MNAKARPAALLGQSNVDEGDGVSCVVEECPEPGLEIDQFNSVQVSDEHRVLHPPAEPLHRGGHASKAPIVSDVVGDQVSTTRCLPCPTSS